MTNDIGSPPRIVSLEPELLENEWAESVVQDHHETERLYGSASSHKQPRPLIFRKTAWSLLLAICAAFALKQFGGLIRRDSNAAAPLFAAFPNPEEQNREVEDSAPSLPEDQSLDRASSDDQRKRLFSRRNSMTTWPDSDFQQPDSPQSTERQDQQCAVETVLKLAGPVFTHPAEEFPNAKNDFEMWTNKIIELKKLIEEKAGAEAAEEFQALILKELPFEQSQSMTTKALSTVVVEIRKQRLAKQAVDCFKKRRLREEAYATVVIMQQHLVSLKKHVNRKEKLPAHLAEILQGFDGEVNMAKEEAELAAARRHYEQMLMEEKTALDSLLYYLVELSGHTAVVEIFQKTDALNEKWKGQIPLLQDAGALLYKLKNIQSLEIPSIGAITALASSLTKARDETLEGKNATYKGVVKLAEIVQMRMHINRNFIAAHDPECEGLTPPMAQNTLLDAYSLMDQLEKLQQETAAFLDDQKDNVPAFESWLALIL